MTRAGAGRAFFAFWEQWKSEVVLAPAMDSVSGQSVAILNKFWSFSGSDARIRMTPSTKSTP